jgi:hypothetical protein
MRQTVIIVAVAKGYAAVIVSRPDLQDLAFVNQSCDLAGAEGDAGNGFVLVKRPVPIFWHEHDHNGTDEVSVAMGRSHKNFVNYKIFG